MEERALNEKESLELIARMIQNSRKNLGIGDRNTFLLWGYLGVFVPLIVVGGVWKTGNPVWNWLWFLIPLVRWPVQYWLVQICLHPPADRCHGGQPQRADRQARQGWLCGGDKDLQGQDALHPLPDYSAGGGCL